MFHPIPVCSLPRRPPLRRGPPRRRNPSNLSYPPLTPCEDFAVTGGLWNCQSATRKADFIPAYASLQSLQFLALTETWITPDNTATPAALSSSFSFSHTPRPSGRGGGTGLLISPSWKFSVLPLSDLSISTFEFHSVAVSYPTNLFIAVIYRPPGPLGNFLDELDTLLSSFPEDGTPLILLGDFNIHLEASQAAAFLPLIHSFGLSLQHSPPTHKAGNVLDLVFVRNCSCSDLTVTPLHTSDHHFISFSLPLPPHPPPPPPTHISSARRNLRSLSPSSFASTVTASLPPLESFFKLPTDSASATLLSSLSSAFDSLCPPVSKPPRTSPPSPWISDTLRTSRTSLRAAERKWGKSRDPSDLTIYQSLLAAFSSAVTAAKAKYYQTQIQNSASNPRKLFSIFSSLLNAPPPPPQSSFAADDFADFFDEKVTVIRRSFTTTAPLTVPFPPSRPIPSFSTFSPLTDSDVSQLLLSHRPTTCALDPIPSSLLQTITPDILPFVTSLVNSSLSSGCFPASSKRAHITPLLKKPTLDPSIIQNYRPVSLLPFLSKTIERAASTQLSSFFSNNNLLDPHQSGFRSGHSTETALLSVSESLHAARAASLSSVLILLDLSAAFDTVDHSILLSALSATGICGTALDWIESYLSGRSFQVAWAGSVSTPRPLATGVPQGSVLGPLLFSLYTRSLGPVITAHGLSYHCYADDTQLFVSFPPSDTQVSARISACLRDIQSWMDNHHLKLNPGKTEMIFIPANTSPHLDLSISLGDTTLTPSPSARNLGVVMDSRLSLSENIAAVTRSCRFFLYNIRRIRPFLTPYSTQLLVQAMVLSRLDYCNSLLAGLPASAIRPLQLIQNAAARLVFNLPKYSHVTPLLTSLHWLPVMARIKFKTLVLAFQAVKGSSPAYLQKIIRPYTPARPLRSASTGRLAPPPLRTSTSRSRLLSVLAPRWWNELPVEVRTVESLPTFKRKLKTHLFKQHLSPSLPTSL